MEPDSFSDLLTIGVNVCDGVTIESSDSERKVLPMDPTGFRDEPFLHFDQILKELSRIDVTLTSRVTLSLKVRRKISYRIESDRGVRIGVEFRFPLIERKGRSDRNIGSRLHFEKNRFVGS